MNHLCYKNNRQIVLEKGGERSMYESNHSELHYVAHTHTHTHAHMSSLLVTQRILCAPTILILHTERKNIGLAGRILG